MEDNGALKACSKIGFLALSLLVIGAVYYYKERMLFADAPYIAFNIINDGKLHIQELRFGSFITQVVPLILSKLHLPLKTILISYSVSFNLFYLIVNACLIWYFRQYGLAVLMSLYYFLFVSATYFWTNNEIHQAIAWMFLFLGLTIHLGKRNTKLSLQIAVFLLLGFTTVFTHFLVVIPCIFLWVFLIIDKSNWPFNKRRTIVMSSLLLVVMLSKFILSMLQPYDGPHLHGPTHFSLHDILNTFSNIVVTKFLERCITNYWVIIPIYLAGIIFLVKTGKKAILSLVLVFTFGYIVAMKMAFGAFGDMLLFYIESEWASMAIVVAASFVFYLLPPMKPRQATVLLGLIFLIRTLYIVNAAPSFVKRTDFEDEVLNKMRQKHITKLILVDSALRAAYIGDWSLPNEGILLSALNGDKPRLTFLFANGDGRTQKEQAANKNFMGSYGTIPIKELNSFYFALDTTSSYEIMFADSILKR
jgi:hypothetical protein